MSIIYDALKKIEVSTDINSTVKIDAIDKPRSKSKYKIYSLYLLVVFIGFLITSMLLGIFTKTSTKAKRNKEPRPPQILSAKAIPDVNVSVHSQPENKPKTAFILNGVFFSSDEGYALINNQIVKKGDVIDGATVLQIDLDEVTLEAKDSTIKLSNRK